MPFSYRRWCPLGSLLSAVLVRHAVANLSSCVPKVFVFVLHHLCESVGGGDGSGGFTWTGLVLSLAWRASIIAL